MTLRILNPPGRHWIEFKIEIGARSVVQPRVQSFSNPKFRFAKDRTCLFQKLMPLLRWKLDTRKRANSALEGDMDRAKDIT